MAESVRTSSRRGERKEKKGGLSRSRVVEEDGPYDEEEFEGFEDALDARGYGVEYEGGEEEEDSPEALMSRSRRRCRGECGGRCDKCKRRKSRCRSRSRSPSPKRKPCDHCGKHCEKWPCSHRQANQPSALFALRLPDLSNPIPVTGLPFGFPVPFTPPLLGSSSAGSIGSRSAGLSIGSSSTSMSAEKRAALARATLRASNGYEEEEEDEVTESKYGLGAPLSAEHLRHTGLLAAEHAKGMQTMLAQASMNVAHHRTEMLGLVPGLLQDQLNISCTGAVGDASFSLITPGRTGCRRAKLSTLIRDPACKILKSERGTITLVDPGIYEVGYGVETIFIDSNNSVVTQTLTTVAAPGATPVVTTLFSIGIPATEIISSSSTPATSVAFIAISLFAVSGDECAGKKATILPGSLNLVFPTGVVSMGTGTGFSGVPTIPGGTPATVAIGFSSNPVQRLAATTLVRACDCNTRVGVLVHAFSNRTTITTPTAGGGDAATFSVIPAGELATATVTTTITPAVATAAGPLRLSSFDGVLFATKLNSGPSTR